MKPSPMIRPLVVAVTLWATWSAASAQVTVDTGLSDYFARVTLGPTSPAPFQVQNADSASWAGSSLTGPSHLATLTREGRTSTSDSTASGVLSGTPFAATFTTASWASAASDNRFSRPTSGSLTATSVAGTDNSITFTVGQLSDYSWSATFLGTVTGNSSFDRYFQLIDSSLTDVAGFGCASCADGTIFGSGQLAAGTYSLLWGGSISSRSLNTGLVGNQTGSAEFTQSGFLTVTAVPEPETYVMMLAGLALAGRVAARRKRKSA